MRKLILTAVLAVLACQGVQARGFSPEAVPPAALAFHRADLHFWALSDSQLVVPNDGKVFGVGVGPDAVSAVLKAAGEPTDEIVLDVNALLLRVGKLTILFDTGVGAAHHGVLMRSLRRAGVAPEDVTHVMITHPHGDHVGGLVTPRGASAFPNAVVRMTADAWARLRRVFPRLAKVIAPQVRTFQPGEELVPDVVRAVPLPGHAPGHTGYEIHSGRWRILDIGDIAHSSLISLAKPEWIDGFDEDRRQARATRLKELRRLARTQELVFAPHFPFPGTGHIVFSDDGYAWKPWPPVRAANSADVHP